MRRIGFAILVALVALVACSKAPAPSTTGTKAAQLDSQKKMDDDFRSQAEAARLKLEADLRKESNDSRATVLAEREARYKQRVLERLKDPTSAQFRGLRFVNGDTVLCGEVNARNSYGGYVGFVAFVVDEENGAYIADADRRGSPMPVEERYGCR